MDPLALLEKKEAPKGDSDSEGESDGDGAKEAKEGEGKRGEDGGPWVSEVAKKAERALAERPYDVDLWHVLLLEAQAMPAVAVRSFHERLVKTFPTCARFWRSYIEHELRDNHTAEVEALFKRSLVRVPNVELWMLYLGYVQKHKSASPGFRESMIAAFEWALKKVGLDFYAYPIWRSYIDFLKKADASTPEAAVCRLKAVRNAYQKALVNPMARAERLWDEYLTFEAESVGADAAERAKRDLSSFWTLVRASAVQLGRIMRSIKRNSPSVPAWAGCTSEQNEQKRNWRAWVQWEQGNPLRTQCAAFVVRRVLFAFEQSLLALAHCPDVWLDARAYLLKAADELGRGGDSDARTLYRTEAEELLERATSTVLEKNLLLVLCFADMAEERKDISKVHFIFNAFLAVDEVDPTLAYVHYMRFARRAEGVEGARGVFRRARRDARCGPHVFVAAAELEFFCGKSPRAAGRIFELGLRRYASHLGYVLRYLRFLWLLREDNNMRVLFERVLSTQALRPDEAAVLWTRYLQLETAVGSISGVRSVEARRRDALARLPNFDTLNAVPQVDRYQFLDLHPEGVRELAPLCFEPPSARGATGEPVRSFSLSSHPRATTPASPQLPRPNFSVMTPWDPRGTAWVGAAGGSFPLPPEVAALLRCLPPPSCFKGPFVKVRELLESIRCLVEVPPRPGPAS